MALVRTVLEYDISESEDCRELTAAKIPFAAGGSGFLAIAGATFFSGTGFLGGTVTKDRGFYALDAAKTNGRKIAQTAHSVRTSRPEDKRVKADRGTPVDSPSTFWRWSRHRLLYSLLWRFFWGDFLCGLLIHFKDSSLF